MFELPDGAEYSSVWCDGCGLSCAELIMCLPRLEIASPFMLIIFPLADIRAPPPLMSCPFIAMTPPLMALTACISVLNIDFFSPQKSNDLLS